jgi:D-galactarolactone cycloisomerase
VTAGAHPVKPALVREAGVLEIASVATTAMSVPLDREYRGSHYAMRNRACIVTRVTTVDGIIGEAYAGDEDATLAPIVAVIRDEIAPRLIGQDAFAYERCWELAFPATFDPLRDRRIGLVAVACVDLAIWDAIGKALGQPLYRIWGGYRDRVPLTICGGYYGRDLGGIREEVSEWLDLGFRGCKFKVGALAPPDDAERVAVVREVAGEGFVITIDANQSYTLAKALDVCARVRDLDIRWFEEPCIWANDRRDLREVRARGGIAICAGQSEFSPEGCRDLMEEGAIDVCNFDASWSGGYTSWRRMAAATRLYSVELGHHEEPQIGSHLLASQPNGTYVEVFHPDRDPIWWNLIANRPRLVDGCIDLPAGPGFGWELDQDYIDRYTVAT